MRFFVLSAVAAFPTSVSDGPTCATGGTGTFMERTGDWYLSLTYCAWYVGVPSTPSDFYSCLNSLPYATPDLSIARGTSLAAAFNGDLDSSGNTLPSACFRCAYEFAMTISAALYNDLVLADTCCSINGTCPVSYMRSLECQTGLYDAITTFNSCSGNGFDFITKAVTTRCTIPEFTDFAIRHNPLSAIAECTYDDPTLTSVSGIENCVGSSYVADKASLTCESCFDPLMISIAGISATCLDLAGFDYSSCQGMDSVVDAFALCAGELTFYEVAEAHCSASQMRVIAAMRPYTAMTQCIYESPSPACLDFYNSVRIALNDLESGTICSDYFATFAYQTFNDPPSECQSTPFAAACTDVLGNYQGYLYNIEVSIGMPLDTNTTSCTVPQWDAISASDKSYIPFIRCGMESVSPADALDCIKNDVLLDAVLAVPCASCFEQLAIEAYVAYKADQSSLTDFACADLYSHACLLAMNRPLVIFKACSGFDAMLISNAECSPEALASLEAQNAGVDLVLALVRESGTVTEAVYMYSQISSALSTTDYPCMYCYLDLIEDLFGLSDDDKAACVADLTSWSCYMAAGDHLNNFWKCTRGWVSADVAVALLPR